MSEPRDPFLERAFDAAREDLSDPDFTATVLERIVARRRRLLAGRLAAVGLLVLIELLLDSPLQLSAGLVAEVLEYRLYEVDNEWLAFAAAPFNSIAGLLGLLLLGLHLMYRRLLR